MNREQVLAALDEVHREGYKYYSAHCPRCGRMNAVPTRQLMLWGQGWTPPQDGGKPKAEPAKAAPKQETAKKAPAKQAQSKPAAKAEDKPKAKAPAKKAATKPAKEEPSTRKKLSSFDFNARTLGALEDAGVTTAAAALKKLGEGKDAVLAINGIGPAGYDEIKQVLKKAGYTLPK
jgi:pyruvate/2-oxoglutarate dehydrogenase complex dihydrolipoamide acyltransferase (E2) component